MPPRIGELNGLLELRLRADDNPLLVDLYPSALQVLRPRHHEMAYIEREVAMGWANRNLDTAWSPSPS